VLGVDGFGGGPFAIRAGDELLMRPFLTYEFTPPGEGGLLALAEDGLACISAPKLSFLLLWIGLEELGRLGTLCLEASERSARPLFVLKVDPTTELAID